MYKISVDTLKEIYKCLVVAQLNHRAISYEEKQNNKAKLRKLQEEIELNYPLITKK